MKTHKICFEEPSNYIFICLKYDPFLQVPLLKAWGFETRLEMLKYCADNRLVASVRKAQYVLINCKTGKLENMPVDVYKEIENEEMENVKEKNKD